MDCPNKALAGSYHGFMAALEPNSRAPDFRLADAEGNEFALYDALRSGPVLITFYKASCPTCQYGLPFLDRLGRSLENTPATAVAVCQELPMDAERFKAEYAYNTHQLFDTEESGFVVSNQYGLTNVPTVFLVGPGGRITETMVSWRKADVEQIARNLGVETPFRPGEDVLPFRPG